MNKQLFIRELQQPFSYSEDVITQISDIIQRSVDGRWDHQSLRGLWFLPNMMEEYNELIAALTEKSPSKISILEELADVYLSTFYLTNIFPAKNTLLHRIETIKSLPNMQSQIHQLAICSIQISKLHRAYQKEQPINRMEITTITETIGQIVTSIAADFNISLFDIYQACLIKMRRECKRIENDAL